MNSCCQTCYDNAFDAKRSGKELENYRKNGPKKNSRPLIEALLKKNLKGRTLLDIGGGIGAIPWELFESGIAKATIVEISSAYIEAFRTEAKNRSLEKKIQTIQGDYLDQYPHIETSDIVTLDKVICCYDNYEELVRHTAAKASKLYGIIIPRDTWWVKIVHGLGELTKRITGNKFRTYIHPVDRIEELIIAAGFSKSSQSIHREWLSLVYQK